MSYVSNRGMIILINDKILEEIKEEMIREIKKK